MIPNILQNFHQKTYRLENIVTEQKNPAYKITKSYARQVEVYYLGKVKEEYRFQLLVVEFDFSDDEDAMGKFIKKISYLFDEIECRVDDEGNITAIDNLLFLRLRWAKIQAHLSETHKGDAVDRYFSQISDLLEDETKLIVFLGSYKMFGLLFNGLLNSFDTKMKRESSEGFTEIINPVKDGNILALKISAENLEESNIEQFRGLFVWKEDRYEEGFIEIKKQNSHLKHSLLWIG
ncbi:hypothetical protein EG344_04775 [Chryseobacterium sp. G0162]|uniref:Uncharacterized protein n=1 Tax=Chryseobacterium nakagawai TaxID=1241982 RepID=A0AAD1DRS9_CHRNA|nr:MULTISPECIES: hypothetical protein [Chryseobacterium]AZA92777.1 hypothetical protein EG343_20370 [Chryseobacterium nakagawai]AZB08220.1 hypothetical protein EG344_04775 [Chryseobacterium sp. G0162]VEH19384.1 Uncharacterised protein [Chryseobacterium nakagawai]